MAMGKLQHEYELDEHDVKMLREAQPRFAPPYQELAADPLAFLFQWAKMTYVFGLPDPARFPALPADLSDRDGTAPGLVDS